MLKNRFGLPGNLWILNLLAFMGSKMLKRAFQPSQSKAQIFLYLE
jgi:hypothetical protein